MRLQDQSLPQLNLVHCNVYLACLLRELVLAAGALQMNDGVGWNMLYTVRPFQTEAFTTHWTF